MDTVDRFITIAHRVVYATVATVDGRGRPRSRVMHPVWQRTDGGGIVGWVTTRPSPLKQHTLAAHPYASVSYWDAQHDTAVAECHARWGTREEEDFVWSFVGTLPAPAGFDPLTIFPGGRDSPDYRVIRFDPWRLKARLATEMMKGEPGLTWSAPSAPAAGRAA